MVFLQRSCTECVRLKRKQSPCRRFYFARWHAMTYVTDTLSCEACLINEVTYVVGYKYKRNLGSLTKWLSIRCTGTKYGKSVTFSKMRQNTPALPLQHPTLQWFYNTDSMAPRSLSPPRQSLMLCFSSLPCLTFPSRWAAQTTDCSALRSFWCWPRIHPRCNQGYFILIEALANRNRFDGDILHSSSSCSVYDAVSTPWHRALALSNLK